MCDAAQTTKGWERTPCIRDSGGDTVEPLANALGQARRFYHDGMRAM